MQRRKNNASQTRDRRAIKGLDYAFQDYAADNRG
jgi:hypothetical protein